MFGAECADSMTLLPLKMNRCPGDQRAHRLVAYGPGGNDRRSGRNSSRCRDHQDRAAAPANRPFVDSPEWRWTRDLCAGLFSALGRYYDEKWFPTVIREWCLLYYRCAHVDDYWQARDEFLAGDQEIRMAVWTEVLAERAENERRLDELRRQAACNENINGDDDFVDEQAQKVAEMRRVVNEANDQIDVKRVDVKKMNDKFKKKPTQSAAEQARAKAEAAELELANPDDNPDWVDMRRKMRGSMAAFSEAKVTVSTELLNHIMIELCKYWANVPDLHGCPVDPMLERNITREINRFRFRVFGVSIDCQQQEQRQQLQQQQETNDGDDDCSNSNDELSCREQEPEEQEEKQDCGVQECIPSPPTPSPCKPKIPEKVKPKSRTPCRPPPAATSQLAGARSRANSRQARN